MSATERDDLARDVFLADNWGTPDEVLLKDWADPNQYRPYAYGIADGLIAKGYRKLRTITTVEELDTLPEGTEIVDHYERLTLQESVLGYLEWHDIHGNVCSVELPATVLSTPEATP